MRNLCFKKGLVVGIIVLFLGIVFAPGFNAISISKEKAEDEEPLDTFTLHVQLYDERFGPFTNGPFIMWAEITVRSINGPIQRIGNTKFGSSCKFPGLPTEYEYDVKAEHWRYKQNMVIWWSKVLVTIGMSSKKVTPRAIENPILYNLPILR